MDMQGAIQRVTEGGDFDDAEMTAVMRSIMTGEATQAQIGGFLVGLRMKGETVTEITAAARVMRDLATPVEVDVPHLVDTCGTGGDGAHTFNISTACAFIVAAAGGHVAKHGNRSVSSASGSADVLEAAGVRVDLDPQQVAQCINDVGLGFMFAPRHHSAMKHAIGPRREMGVRTIFNLLGPLTNPARAPYQLIGVFLGELIQPLAQVLGQLGSRHVLVVHADDGLDEISTGAATQVAEWRNGELSTYTITPQDYGMSRTPVSAISADNAQQSLAMIEGVFAGEPGPARDIVLLNAGAALYACDLAENIKAGISLAETCIANGQAQQRIHALAELSQQLAD